MKYTSFFLFLFCFFSASAQTDSAKTYVKNVGIQARDLEAMIPLITYGGEVYEDAFDLIKKAYKNNPSNQTVITLDSIRNDALLGIAHYVLDVQYGFGSNFTNRVQAVLDGVTEPYFARQWALIKQDYTDRFSAIRTEGSRRYKQKRN